MDEDEETASQNMIITTATRRLAVETCGVYYTKTAASDPPGLPSASQLVEVLAGYRQALVPLYDLWGAC